MQAATRPDARQRVLVFSIHDVTPGTLPQCHEILERLDAAGHGPVTLLVVPGKTWNDAAIDTLKAFAERGAILAGHGWHHRAKRIATLRHKLHSALISRDVAEHLALDEAGIVALMNRCHAWFEAHDLQVSGLYVPPAWALGSIRRRTLRNETPFTMVETLTGTIDTAADRFRVSAMVGFEADNAFRALACSVWNGINLFAAGRSHPVRVAIHPNDLSLNLARRLERLIERGGHSVSYDIFRSAI